MLRNTKYDRPRNFCDFFFRMFVRLAMIYNIMILLKVFYQSDKPLSTLRQLDQGPGNGTIIS